MQSEPREQIVEMTPVVPGGMVHYRRRVRALGPLAALLVPGMLGLLAWLLLRTSTAPWRGALGALLAIAAAPALLVVGGPLATGVPLRIAGIAVSAALWWYVGLRAARRATALPAADWSDYRRELWWSIAAVWCGSALSVVAIVVLFGRSLA